MTTSTDKPAWEQIRDARLAAIDTEIESLVGQREAKIDEAKRLTSEINEKRHERDAVLAYEYVGRPRAHKPQPQDSAQTTLLDDDGPEEAPDGNDEA